MEKIRQQLESEVSLAKMERVVERSKSRTMVEPKPQVEFVTVINLSSDTDRSEAIRTTVPGIVIDPVEEGDSFKNESEQPIIEMVAEQTKVRSKEKFLAKKEIVDKIQEIEEIMS